MKALIIAAFAAPFLLSPSSAVAQPADPHSHSGKAPDGASSKSGIAQMDEQRKKMQALHERMASATTPEERQKLMEEHRKAMQEGMGMMNQMMHGGGMMGSMGGRSAAPKGKAQDPSSQLQMLQMRMDMMQMMMQMMMDQQGMAGGLRTTPGGSKN